ncbi:3-keto-5-aminohexanoate cleavage protein [Intestinimonas massiliensis (ex Afouda et al. 2020)]|uniref:3-keto-5-aminohexanoate cleavage protein n=1 Tax=Intestinimonas massiliensis (ex Afouda et al. 2020) TaxID=1673721 RepID=UPI001032007F|nr:3-keto-5-aminohexanoate cleavage protein [Intestinimonas massiliensis (ex Afouda et al. 2020)]
MIQKKAILTAAISGAVHTAEMSPYLPITPAEIISQSVEAYEAGAAVVHIHARDPETGEPTSDLEVMGEIIAGIKRRCDVVICITTGASQMMTTQERLAVVPRFQPELASCNAGSMNFVLAGLVDHLPDGSPEWARRYLGGTYDNVFSNTYLGLETYIRTMQENGTVPEFEVYDAGMINNIAYFQRKGILTAPIYIQFVLGIQGGLPATVDNLVFLRTTAERQLGSFHWSVAAAGKAQFPIAAAGLAMGGGVRVGLEDNLYIRPHELAKSNAQQIQAVAEIVKILGREPAAPEEARQILGLKGSSQTHY